MMTHTDQRPEADVTCRFRRRCSCQRERLCLGILLLPTSSTRATSGDPSLALGMSKRSHDEATTADAGQATSSMRVLGTTTFGRSNLQFLDDRPIPQLGGPSDVLIRVLYSDLNPVDHHKLNTKPSGTPVPDHRSPFIVGFGGCGIVVAVGSDASNDLMDQRVAFLADPSKDGSYAEYVVCDARTVAPLPAGTCIQSHEAACVPVAGLTALESLQKAGIPIRKSPAPPPEVGTDRAKKKRLLIVGGAGGVGSWAAQLARAAHPHLEVVGTASTPESAAWCKDMGCDRTIGHDEIDSLGGGREGSCDHILCLAEPTPQLFSSMAEVLRPFGTIVLVVARDAIQSLDLSFVFFKCGTVATQTVFSSIRDGYRLDQAEEMAIILDLMRQGRVKAPISGDWDEGRSDWSIASGEGGLIDIVGGGHSRGKMVMKIAKDL